MRRKPFVQSVEVTEWLVEERSDQRVLPETGEAPEA